MNKTITSLGLGFSRLLCFSYGGFLLVVCAACFAPAKVKTLIDALHPSLAILAVVVIGSAIYILHHTIVMPVHHLLVGWFFRVTDKSGGIRDLAESTSSPTIYLGEALGVAPKRRTAAYNVLRHSNFFTNKESLEAAHAENGLLVMTGVGLLIAALYGLAHRNFLLALVLFILAVIFVAASFKAQMVQYSIECMAIKERPVEAMNILVKTGILRTEDVESMIELEHLKDSQAMELLEQDQARKERVEGPKDD
ncbi:MAG: hypothetical protein JXA81_00575 [Sedimentisphaerales bacterium]|nr:hypothetical protein [Sedimentisphaerales bacterium]